MRNEEQEKGGKGQESEVEGEAAFSVRDRRKFSAEGERRPKEQEAAPQGPAAQGEGGAAAPRAGTPDQEVQEGGAEERAAAGDLREFLPLEVSFGNFILSLGTSAVLHFGEIPDPVTGAREKNLPMAKHTIDLLSMLREKTKGNLDGDEERLLDNLLYQLRMKYVSLT